MAFIDVVEWSPRTNDIYAWKFPHENLSTNTQLLVRESQEAVFFSKGQIIGKFGPGKHVLTTENLPLLRKLYGIPFGGKNPFLAEVWFVNKAMPLTIDWRTTSMRIMDPAGPRRREVSRQTCRHPDGVHSAAAHGSLHGTTYRQNKQHHRLLHDGQPGGYY